MNIISRYIIRSIFIGFAAAAALLLPLFTTFDFISELDDVSPHGYRWSLALMVVLMRLPRCLVDLSPFIALLGGIVGLGQLSKNLELTAIRTAGFSVLRISLAVLYSGVMLVLLLAAVDEWVASPLQQHALQIKDAAIARENSTINNGKSLWARRNNEFVTVNTLDEKYQPGGIEIFRFRADLTLEDYIYAEKATVAGNGIWILHGIHQKSWQNGNETVTTKENMAWKSIFTMTNLEELTMPSDSFTIRQLTHYIRYLQNTGQPSIEFTQSLWQKLGRPLLILAMILLAVPFTFSNPRDPGLGSRLAVGVIVGLLTYISDQIVVNLGLLYSLNPPLTTLAPPFLMLLIALLLISRFDRQL